MTQNITYNNTKKTAAAKQRRGEAATPALCAGRALPASPEKKEGIESATDNQEAKEKKAESYLKTKWPNAKLANVKGGTYLDILRIQETEKLCAECPGIKNCQKNGNILHLIEDTKNGRPLYRIVYGPCGVMDNSAQPEVSHELTINEAPEAMRITAEYLLLKTGRASLTEAEISALRTLNAHHYPARVQEEIDKAIERFTRRGEPLSKLKFTYIAKALGNQMSRNPRKTGFQRVIEHDYGPKFEEYETPLFRS